ncbi:unnamed protein product, partial [Heterotrigona itama]
MADARIRMRVVSKEVIRLVGTNANDGSRPAKIQKQTKYEKRVRSFSREVDVEMTKRAKKVCRGGAGGEGASSGTQQ